MRGDGRDRAYAGLARPRPTSRGSSRRAAVALLVAALGCTLRDPGVTLPDRCQETAVRRCEHPCGHGVEHCVDPKRGWGECECAVSARDWLDGSVPDASAAGSSGAGNAGAGTASGGNAGSF